MAQLKVIILGTTPAETLYLEQALNDSGYLGSFRYVAFDAPEDRMPEWDSCDLIMARYQEKHAPQMLSLLAPVLRKSSPNVIFLVDPFDPLLVTRLLNTGARHVLPLNSLDAVLCDSLASIYGPEPVAPRVSRMVTKSLSDNGLKPAAAADPASPQTSAFLDLFRSSPVGMCILRRCDGRLVACNDSLASLLEWSCDELIGQELLELGLLAHIQTRLNRTDLAADRMPEENQPSDDGPSSDGPSTDGLSPDGTSTNAQSAHRPLGYQTAPLAPVLFERKVYTRTRQVRYALVHLQPLEWAGEDCLFALVQDITDREQMKQRVQQLSEERDRMKNLRSNALEAFSRELDEEIIQRKLFEQSTNQLTQVMLETPDVVAISDANGRMVFLNKAGRALFGLGEHDLDIGLTVFSIYSEPVRKWMMEEIHPILLRDGIWHGETQFHHKDGRVIPLSQVLLCKKDETGRVAYYASISRDISELKRVEQNLRQSEERYRKLAEAAHDLIFMVSKDGRMEYANGYACRALGFDPQKVPGMPASQFFPKDFASNHLQMFYEVHEINQPVYTEGPFFRGGEQIWLGTWLVPIHSPQGSLASILGISRDITEQKKTDEALQRALQNERKLGEMRSNFFSMTSHQFRTPLSTILLSAELLQKYGQKWDEQKRGEHLGRIQEAARRLNSMLEDILVIGRVESGRYVCIPREFDLIAYCDQTVREISLNDRSTHTIQFEHEALDRLIVYLDPEVLHRVIDNLLSNALKYSPRNSSVVISVKKEDPYVLLEVTDQGIGIPERDLKYLFQPFQRGSNAAEFPGTGIGLTIIQKSVELMKGNVSLKSKEGQGTTFMVRLPIHIESETDRMFV